MKSYPQGYHELQHDEECKDMLVQATRFFMGLIKAGPYTRGPLPAFSFKPTKKKSRSLWKLLLLLLAVVLAYRWRGSFQQLWGMLLPK
jgi:hypothetical protein